jgi:hypothetical protein
MEPHGTGCGWFWAWTAAGFGLVLGFLAIATLVLGLRPALPRTAAGIARIALLAPAGTSLGP